MSKDNLHHKGYTGSCDVSFEDECLHGKILFIDDLITYEGDTPKELQDAFRAAVDRYLEHCKKTGKPANKPYSGSFNVRVGPERHRKAAIAAHMHEIGLNDFVVQAIDAALEVNCFAKVEHIHNQLIATKTDAVLESRIATSTNSVLWEPMYATHH